MKDNDILRRYIREVLQESNRLDEKGLAAAARSAGENIFSVLGGSSQSSGPQKWFDNFMSKKLSKIGEKIDEWLGKKLIGLLPDEFVKNLKSGTTKEEAVSELSTDLAKIVDSWIEDVEDTAGKKISSSKKKEIVEYAAEVLAKYLKKYPDDPYRALQQVSRGLDAKYGSALKSKNKSEKA